MFECFQFGLSSDLAARSKEKYKGLYINLAAIYNEVVSLGTAFGGG